jgi:hypothetical protein
MNWNVHEPTGGLGGVCVRIRHATGYWYDENCEKPYYFICEKGNKINNYFNIK